MAPADGLSSTTNAKRAPVGVPSDITISENGDSARVLKQAPAPGHFAMCGGPRGLGGTEDPRTATGDMMELAVQQKAKSAVARPRNSYTNVTCSNSLYWFIKMKCYTERDSALQCGRVGQYARRSQLGRQDGLFQPARRGRKGSGLRRGH